MVVGMDIAKPMQSGVTGVRDMYEWNSPNTKTLWIVAQ